MQRSLTSPLIRIGAVLVTLALAGCSSAAPAESGPAAAPAPESGAFPVSVEHSLGTTTVERAPERIVTLGMTDADVVLALGEVPVGIASPYNFPRGVGVWAEDELGAATPAVMGREINYEAVAALQPDLILDVVSGGEQERYDTLSRIAPTVALPAGALPYAPAWQESTELIAEALGKEAEGAELVARTERYVTDVAAAHPGFAGRTLTYIDAYGAEAYAGGRDATAVQLMGELGFEPVPYLRDLQSEETQILVSNELLGQLDADVVLLYAFGETPEQALQQNAGLGTLPAVRDGRAYWLPDLSLSAPSVLSIPYGVDTLLPFLEGATS
ncbi:iron-siderophore ABC transporter substrate-binding protein [Pseudonocardia sp. MH-G8]|uniref:ABC transporter substrate-binding protein n=1 Tax=Pseudonocardia sp. MH-G8 TaxID=1854588 RepID=UPI001304463F|nr:iron-siderophore ABC transporter substrate-binding protein [Pseudonocardia sp. MH-G8]